MPIRSVFSALSNQIASNKQEQRDATLYRNLMRHEARIGGTVFGAIPKDRRREFFCLDKHTWVWHEEWTGNDGKRQVMTTRYDVRPDSILKSQNGSHYQPVAIEEAERLAQAAQLYRQKVNKEIYNFA